MRKKYAADRLRFIVERNAVDDLAGLADDGVDLPDVFVCGEGEGGSPHLLLDGLP